MQVMQVTPANTSDASNSKTPDQSFDDTGPGMYRMHNTGTRCDARNLYKHKHNETLQIFYGWKEPSIRKSLMLINAWLVEIDGKYMDAQTSMADHRAFEFC